MLEQFTEWLGGLVADVFAALWSFVKDAIIEVFDLLLQGIVHLVGLLGAPSFLTSGLGSLFADLGPATLFLLGSVRVPEVLAMVGTAYAFRLGRKVVTLFQW